MIILLRERFTSYQIIDPRLTSSYSVVVCSAAIGANVQIPPGVAKESGLLEASKLGWQLLYILPVALIFNGMCLLSSTS